MRREFKYKDKRPVRRNPRQEAFIRQTGEMVGFLKQVLDKDGNPTGKWDAFALSFKKVASAQDNLTARKKLEETASKTLETVNER